MNNETKEKPLEQTETKEVIESTRTKRDIKVPKKYDNYVCYVNFSNTSVPKSYEEAINSSESKLWKSAINDELSSLKENDTWSIVDKPTNKKIVEVK